MSTYEVGTEDTSKVDPAAPFLEERLEAIGLTKRFKGRTVVKGVSLEVRAGEIVGLLGPNGAGKTTIFDMMVGLC
ncbi:MAG: ATP-binding cassette domain-containing protein, partial [Nitrospirota bacterium]|nr:ATP-binding cassette domain-containing protein [Nitrospirota bacterium]